jgi:hypothetical protein
MRMPYLRPRTGARCAVSVGPARPLHSRSNRSEVDASQVLGGSCIVRLARCHTRQMQEASRNRRFSRADDRLPDRSDRPMLASRPHRRRSRRVTAGAAGVTAANAPHWARCRLSERNHVRRTNGETRRPAPRRLAEWDLATPGSWHTWQRTSAAHALHSRVGWNAAQSSRLPCCSRWDLARARSERVHPVCVLP